MNSDDSRPTGPLLPRAGGPSTARFEAAYCAYAFLFDLVFCYAVYTALFELRGLDAVQIGALIAFWSASAVVLEIPTGALSDRYDRRLLLIAAPLVKALTFVLWGVADGDVLLYGAGFACWSAGSALYSGTGEALLFERLDADGQAHTFDRALGRASAAESLGIGSGLLLGGLLAAALADGDAVADVVRGMTGTVWLSIPPLLLASAVALALRDVRRDPSHTARAHDDDDDDAHAEASYLGHLRNAAHALATDARLRHITGYIAGGLIVFEVLEEFEQLYYLAVHLPLWLYGAVGAAALAGQALASLQAYRLSGQRWLAWTLPLASGALLLLSGRADHPAWVLAVLFAYVLVAPVTVLSEARFQAVQSHGSRATTTSMLVVAQNVTGIGVTLLIGWLADRIGIGATYAWAGATMLPFALWTIWMQRRGEPFVGEAPTAREANAA